MYTATTISVFRAWLAVNTESPFPSINIKTVLAVRTGMTVPEVARWFANERKKHLRRQRTKHEVETKAAKTADSSEEKTAAVARAAAMRTRPRSPLPARAVSPRPPPPSLRAASPSPACRSPSMSPTHWHDYVLRPPDHADRLLLRLVAGEILGDGMQEELEGCTGFLTHTYSEQRPPLCEFIVR